jgi:hypothetical protein
MTGHELTVRGQSVLQFMASQCVAVSTAVPGNQYRISWPDSHGSQWQRRNGSAARGEKGTAGRSGGSLEPPRSSGPQLPIFQLPIFQLPIFQLSTVNVSIVKVSTVN